MGCPVPAASATLTVADRIFTRLGAYYRISILIFVQMVISLSDGLNIIDFMLKPNVGLRVLRVHFGRGDRSDRQGNVLIIFADPNRCSRPHNGRAVHLSGGVH